MKRSLTICLLGMATIALADGATQPDVPNPSIPARIRGKPDAPEFKDISDWINSDPLTMAQLKGKVVVVHFMAFGCVNCHHNYPWYRSIAKDFKSKDLVMIGIHTPETDAEKDVKAVAKAMEKAGLTFPIAIDNKKTMWKAYTNGYWPTVYLIDKQGKARYFWSGELSGNGAKGEVYMRRLIVELLKG